MWTSDQHCYQVFVCVWGFPSQSRRLSLLFPASAVTHPQDRWVPHSQDRWVPHPQDRVGPSPTGQNESLTHRTDGSLTARCRVQLAGLPFCSPLGVSLQSWILLG